MTDMEVVARFPCFGDCNLNNEVFASAASSRRRKTISGIMSAIKSDLLCCKMPMNDRKPDHRARTMSELSEQAPVIDSTVMNESKLLTLVLAVQNVVNRTGEFFMASTNQKVHGIIHAASNACAGIDGSLAQAPESDSVAIVPIQTTMIVAIASEHGIEITNAAAADLLLTFSATVRSRQVLSNRQALVGWLPGIDIDNNDSTAAALTEAIGWAANSYFDQAEAKTKT